MNALQQAKNEYHKKQYELLGAMVEQAWSDYNDAVECAIDCQLAERTDRLTEAQQTTIDEYAKVAEWLEARRYFCYDVAYWDDDPECNDNGVGNCSCRKCNPVGPTVDGGELIF